MFVPDAVAHLILDTDLELATLYLGLSTTEPTLSGGVFTNITEPTDPTYARQAVAPADWANATGRAKETTAAVSFPDVPTGENWGVCPYWFLATASTAGTVEYAGEGDQALTLSAGTSNISVTPRIESPSDFTTLT